jgi:SAM-dependent methyltransferase
MNADVLASVEAQRLTEEAAFADTAYAKFANQLALNETFFHKYAAPAHDWDWREWGAKRLGNVAGCRLLDYGCGAGEEAVYFAKLGASVTAIDISPVGVQLTNERARFNGVDARLTATRMRCDPTEFPDASFDVVHGFGILHHVGLRSGLQEVHRLLVPGGRALFFEHMGNSRLIEWLRPKEGHYTTGERPVTWSEVVAMRAQFSRFDIHPFHIISRLRNRMSVCGTPTAKRIDHALLTALPFLRHFASGVVICLQK